MDHNDLRDHDARRRADDADTVHSIKLTPTWSGVLQILLATYRDGSARGQQLALAELIRMARLADAYVADHPEK
jgi:hypothetical protein